MISEVNLSHFANVVSLANILKENLQSKRYENKKARRIQNQTKGGRGGQTHEERR